MDPNLRAWINPLRFLHGRRAPETASLRARPQRHCPTVPGDAIMGRPLQPPRERGTCRALGLAVALHALLAAVLFSEMPGPGGHPAADHQAAGAVDASPPRLLASVVTRIAPTATVPAASQTVAHPESADPMPRVLRRHRLPVTAHPTRDTQLAARSHAGQPVGPAVPMAGAPELSADAVASRERQARLAALQAMAAASLPGNSPPQRERDAVATLGYADRVAHRVRANVIAPFPIQGNPSAVVAVTCAPNGALLSATIQRSSGNPQWDEAVLVAVEKSDPMPVDVNGAAPASFTLTFQPKG